MKLRELVANSLPRVRGRKKKTTSSATTPASTAEAAAIREVSTESSSVDKNKSRFQSIGFRSDSRDNGLDVQGIAEASWRGNALYRGLEAARAVKCNSRLMSASYTSSHGMVTSHSAEGFSSQLMTMSRSYDSRLTVPDCNDSCPQMSFTSETCTEPFSSPQQYYHCHYHRHNHHHYHHHHLHPKPMAPLAQNQQRLCPDVDDAKYLSSYKSQEDAKPEPGFFRKSFASFRSMRKCSSKATKDSKQNGVDKMVCSVCPYPESAVSPTEKKSAEKRPTKPKRKSLKGFSKLKENRFSPEKRDKSCFSDNDSQNVVNSTIARADPNILMFPTLERSYIRERSVESCSSRLYGSREGFCVRDIDFTGFDSASLSGYESDLPRSKVHRSRSRIKTNPWLPSPQPSMSGGKHNDHCELRESTEDIVVAEESSGRFPRSASFEYQRSGTALFQTSPQNDSDRGNNCNQRPRSLTPSDNKVALSLTPYIKSPTDFVKPTWRTTNRENGAADGSKNSVSVKAGTLNDLNNDAPKSRPTSTVSPNSEFVMLADNLEQLANNISFEYEEMLDTTLESVSICQEDGQASIQELLTDEENGNVTKTFLKSDGDIHSAHSPDSGIGGLGSTDGDEALTPNAQTEQQTTSMECLPSQSSVGAFETYSGTDPNLNLLMPNEIQNPQKEKFLTDSKCLLSNTFNSCNSFVLSKTDAYNTRSTSHKHKMTADKHYILDNDSSATFSESDIDNTSYQDTRNTSFQEKQACVNRPDDKVLRNKKPVALPSATKIESSQNYKATTLMVDERLDIQFHPSHRHFHGCGIIMGTGGAMHDHAPYFGTSSKQSFGKVSDSSAVVFHRNPRPCALKAGPSAQEVPKKMNDMEKSSNQVQHRTSWSVEFNFPRNISTTEFVESPTENWQCDDDFSMCTNQNTFTLSQQIEHSQTTENRLSNEDTFDNAIENEELVVKLDDIVSNGSQTIKQAANKRTSQTDSGMHKPEAESLNISFEMSDACVQTDFDDDFSRWEEADTLESLEEQALDPAESTRIWLLTGNMQGSADTGYSSLTRDSQIFMDEDSLFLAGELEERAAAERMSYGESSNTENNNEKIPTNSSYLKADSHDTIVSADLPQNGPNDSLTEIKNFKSQDGRMAKTLSEKESVSSEIHTKSFTRNEQASNSSRTIPHSTVKQMFSNIESQFQDIFQQIYDDRRNFNSTAKRTSSDSSDSTLKSSDSDDLECNALQGNVDEYTKNKDSETGETKVCLKSSSDTRYRNIQSTKSLSKNVLPKWMPRQSDVKNCVTDIDANLNLGHARLKPEEPLSQFCGHGRSCKHAHCHSNELQVRIVPSSERADYLEFLRDAPLSRSHLKRPLFLVPGLGPVDMSCSEQINLFTENGMSSNKSLPHCSSSSARTSTTPSMSPSAAHCWKKLKKKKGDHMLSDQARSNADIAAVKNSNSVFSCLHHNHPVPHLVTPSSCKENTKIAPLVVTSDGNGRVLNPVQNGASRYVTHSQNSQLPLTSTPAITSTEADVSKTSEEKKQKDDATKSLTEKVLSLRREKDMVFQKIQEARKDEKIRQEQRQQIQRHMHAQRKEALLETLHDLKNKLEEQSKLLKQREGSSGQT